MMGIRLPTNATTYRPRNHESREQVPKTEEGCGDNGCKLQVGRDCHAHHAVEGEDEEGEEHEEDEVEELGDSPFEVNHGIDNRGVQQGLSKYIRNLDSRLKTQ
jgi:hypothetical protein